MPEVCESCKEPYELCRCESLFCDTCGDEIPLAEQDRANLCFEHQGHARCCARMPHQGETPHQEGP